MSFFTFIHFFSFTKFGNISHYVYINFITKVPGKEVLLYLIFKFQTDTGTVQSPSSTATVVSQDVRPTSFTSKFAIKVCLYVTSPSPCPSKSPIKFNVALVVTETLTGKWVAHPSVYQGVHQKGKRCCSQKP